MIIDGFLTKPLPAPFPRNVFGVSLSTKPIDPIDDLDSTSKVEEHNKTDEPKWRNTKAVGEKDKKPVEEVDVLLVESETISFLETNSIDASKHMPGDEDVKMRNERYKQLLQSKEGSDAYIGKSVLTINEESKCKSTQTSSIKAQDVSTNVNAWECWGPNLFEDIKQDYMPLQSIGKKLSFDEISLLDSFSLSLMVMERMLQLKSNQSELALYRNLPALDSTTPHPEPKPPHGNLATTASPTRRVEPTQIKKSLAVDDTTPRLTHLWTFFNEVIKSRPVTCMVWNPRNLDLLAVGYGRVEKPKPVAIETMRRSQTLKARKMSTDKETSSKEGEDLKTSDEEMNGVVCCWSIKNLEHPERIYKTKGAVTSLDFCRSQPSFLAVGLESSTIHVYDISTRNVHPLINNFNHPGKHQGPVWSVKWNEGERSGHASVISMSADGKVIRWIIREELECCELLEMRRMRSMISLEKSTQNVSSSSSSPLGCEPIISKFIGGLCMDFNAVNDNIYLIGTEHGDIHRCDCTYIDQYIQTYIGHNGPVYEVSWSPFNRDVFLSCGSDWTTRLWVQGLSTPVSTMFSSQKSPRSICWSPRCSTVFISVNSDDVEIWNFACNLLEPILKFSPKGHGLTKVLYALNTDCILVGRTDSGVSVFKVTGIKCEEFDQEGILNAIIDNCQEVLFKTPFEDVSTATTE